MSNVVFQPSKGLAWNIKKHPKFATGVQTASSGRQVRAAYQQYPIWEFELPFEFLRGTESSAPGTYNELQALMGFHGGRRGGFDNFLYSDPNDNSVTMMPFGVGDGSTSAFQLTRKLGELTDIVQNVDVSGMPPVVGYPSPLVYKHDFQGTKNLMRSSAAIGDVVNGWTVSYAAFTSGVQLPPPIVTLNAAFAPDGSCTASKIVFPEGPSNGDVLEVYQGLANPAFGGRMGGRTFTFSVWLRVDSGSYPIQLQCGDNVSFSQSSFVTLTSQWQRASVTVTFPGGNTNTSLVGVFSSYFPNGAATLYAWGAQLEEGPAATAYQATSSTNSFGPLYQYPSARTNSALWSQAFDNAAWGYVNVTRPTADTISAPDGTATAEALTVITGGVDSYTIQPIASPSSFNSKTMTFSVWLKVPSGTLNGLRLFITYDSGTFQTFSLPVNLTTKWQRFTVQATLPAGLTTLGIQIGGGNTFTTGTIHVWGAQLENWGNNTVGTYPWAGGGAGIDGGTSYIPTTSTAVTVTDYSLGSTGIVTFAAAPAANALLAWTGNYYFRVRFVDDLLDFNEMMYQLWEMPSLKMESVIL